MKQKSVKRMLGFVLAGTLMVGSFAGCGSKETESPAADDAVAENDGTSEEDTTSEEDVQEDVTYPLEGEVTLKIAMAEESQVTSSGAKNLFDTPLGKAWQENTGVKVEVLQLADADAMNLMFASGDLPDLIWYQFSNYNGGAAKAIKDKIIEPLNDYTNYLPDMMAALESDPDYIKSTTTDGGDIIGGPFVRSAERLKTSAGLIVRQDWLDDLNLDVPQTPDEVYNVLKAFKEEKGAEAPLSLGQWWLHDITLGNGIITSPFGLPKCNIYQENGTVHYGYYESEYKGVLEWLNKLYTEGLLDPNFQTLDQATQNANIMTGVSGMTVGNNGGVLGTCINTMKDSDPNYNLTGVAPLVEKEGDIAMSTHYDNAVNGWYLVMTPNCQNKEAAAKFINYGYTEEGQMLLNFGIEGESYTNENGTLEYTDLIVNNPDGLTMQQALAQYQNSWTAGPMLQREECADMYNQLEQQHDALTAWSTSNAKDYQYPMTTVADEDASELSKLASDINVYSNEMMVKYITGQESLDNFETEYLATLKDMGVERMIEIYQKALDNYNAR